MRRPNYLIEEKEGTLYIKIAIRSSYQSFFDHWLGDWLYIILVIFELFLSILEINFSLWPIILFLLFVGIIWTLYRVHKGTEYRKDGYECLRINKHTNKVDFYKNTSKKFDEREWEGIDVQYIGNCDRLYHFNFGHSRNTSEEDKTGLSLLYKTESKKGLTSYKTTQFDFGATLFEHEVQMIEKRIQNFIEREGVELGLIEIEEPKFYEIIENGHKLEVQIFPKMNKDYKVKFREVILFSLFILIFSYWIYFISENLNFFTVELIALSIIALWSLPLLVSYNWDKNGVEHIIIDKKKEKFTFYRKGLIQFNTVVGQLNILKYLGNYDQLTYDYAKENHNFRTTDVNRGNKLCVMYQRKFLGGNSVKRVARFGAILSKREQRHIERRIQQFLTKQQIVIS